MERRTFIIGAVAGGIGLLQYALVTRYMNRLREPRGVSLKDYLEQGERAALLAIRPNEDFYAVSKGDVPSVRAANWHLKIDGFVARPLTLTYSELLAQPHLEKVLTLECISNPIGGHYLGNARWTGTPLRPLFEHAQPLKEAAYAILYAADGYATGHPAARLFSHLSHPSLRPQGVIPGRGVL